MKTKYIFVILMTFVLLAACRPVSATFAVTPTLVTGNATQTPTFTPTSWIYPTQTPSPTPSPYPTASVVQANTIAFIANNALWIANVDGSGERKLADGVKDGLTYGSKNYPNYYYLKWSPDGKWITYTADNALWIASHDGVVNKKLLTFPKETEFGYAWAEFDYEWSPDSSKIAYALPVSENAALNWTPTVGPTPTIRPMSGGPSYPPYLVGMIEITTGEVFPDLAQFKSYRDILSLSWLPDSRRLLFLGPDWLEVFEISERKIVIIKEKDHQCFGGVNPVSWSPDGNKFIFGELKDRLSSFHTVCIASLTEDSIHLSKVSGISSFYEWDKTGNALYFITRDVDSSGVTDVYIDERLMRYDVRTQKSERLLSIRDKEIHRIGYGDAGMSLSPNKKKILICWADTKTENHYILINLQTMAATKFTTELPMFPTWAADSENLIYLMSPSVFYRFNLQTQEITAFTGLHLINRGEWAVSPVAHFP